MENVESVQRVPGQALLRSGDYERGLEAFERRLSRLNCPPRANPIPEWRGETLDGRTILLWGEDGLGDEIQMVRFVRALRARGAGSVILACHPLNVRLFQDVGADRVVGRFGQVILPDYHCWAALMSLPYLLDVRPDTLDGAPYLSRIGGTVAGRIGLAWRGQPLQWNDGNRSLPEPDLLADVPGGMFLEPSGDMLDSALQVSECEAVVTVCTSWAHLAGAIGVKTFLLLAHEADWRWGLSDRSPWYESVQIYRQPAPGDWAEPIGRATRDLRDLP